VKKLRLNHLVLFLYWVLVFVIGKAFFLAYHSNKTATLTFGEIVQVFTYGLRLDFSMAAYISVLPFLILLFTPPLPRNFSRHFINSYAVLITLLITLLNTVDLHLYGIWGFKLDSTPIQYLNTPAEMAASSAGAPIFLLFILFLAQLVLCLILYFRFFQLDLSQNKATFWHYSIAFFWLILLILPLRGGWQQIPVNQSDVYFSEKPFANHAAVNVTWNVGYSLTKTDFDGKNPYKYLPEEEAKKTVADLYKKPEASPELILKTKRPNVLFIILESYTAKLVGCLNGEKGITPELDKLAREGILFTNFYASGDRSEKGLVALLSGYPVQTTTSIIKIPRKTERLPHLAKSLKNAGYQTSYYYGGELAFANIKSYVLTAGYDKLVSKSDFPAKEYNSKWGVHDHVLLNRVLADLNKQKQPFFSTVFTLSSHEPYDVPMETKFPGNDEANKFRNAFYYTDQSIGNFIREAKKQAWWKNTLVVLVADHGHALPNYDEQNAPTKFHIPLILTGGALAKTNTHINIVASQTDLAYSLLGQLKQPTQDFIWSKDLFNSQAKPFAFYVYNDGFGYVTDKGNFSFDNVYKKEVHRSGEITEQDIKSGKAYMQYSFEDYLKK
jgi:phosphoglycerol transferase MdoB-like AlkP superfamily enzyme